MAYRPHINDAQQILTDDEIIGLMPKSFAFIANLVGIPQALNIIDNYGGTKIFIPSKHALGIQHEFARVIGLNSLRILANQCGNNTIEIPMGTPITIAMRNRMIRNMSQNESHSKLARKFGVTMRTIRSIVSNNEKLKTNQDKNLDLFDEKSGLL